MKKKNDIDIAFWKMFKLTSEATKATIREGVNTGVTRVVKVTIVLLNQVVENVAVQ